MKRVLSIIVLVLSSLVCHAAIPGRFSSVHETIGKEIVIFDAELACSYYGPYLYIGQNNKLRLVRNENEYQTLLSRNKVFGVVGEVEMKNKKYLQIKNGDDLYYLLLSPKIDYCHYFLSYSYWTNIIEHYRKEYQYKLNGSFKSTIHPALQYKAIEWLDFVIPDDINRDISFRFYEKTLDQAMREVSSEIRSLSYDYISRNSRYFCGKDKFQADVNSYLEMERLDTITGSRPILARILNTSNSRGQFNKSSLSSVFNLEDGYRVALYESYQIGTKNNFRGVFAGTEMSFGESDLRFDIPSDADYLIRRKEIGALKRKQIARASDSLYHEHLLDSLAEEVERNQARLDKIQSFFREKKIFVLSQEYVYGDYGQVGVKFDFFNPWKKQIKYINLTMTPYNSVNDIQKDEIGRDKQSVRCIGPIQPNEIGTYSFERMYWNESGVISRIDVTYVKITFMDNSVLVYSSKSQVDSHRRSHYSYESIWTSK